MGNGLYTKLAFDNIRKNKRLYIPQMLTGAGLIAVFYIIETICKDEKLSSVRGGSYLPTIMQLGMYIMIFISAVLILYTNSFLMKQRKREYGLYNVLGMDKKHVGRVMMFEAVISQGISIVAGLFLGVLFYKLCQVFVCRILNVDTILGFDYIVPKTLIITGLMFAGIYLFTFIINRIQLARLNPIELLKSANTGEKEPRIKWVILVIGLLTLGIGYYISFTTVNPLKALVVFFIAVGLIIIGTYAIFTAGSIALLKFLKKRTGFYYHKKHMTAVSGLLYRMKQNAVGLASICILSTAMIVMISATVSLYIGLEDTLDKNYPYDISVRGNFDATDGSDSGELARDAMTKAIEEVAEREGLTISEKRTENYLNFGCAINGNKLILDDYNEINIAFGDGLFVSVYLITEEEYMNLTGNKLELQNNDIAVCLQKDSKLDIDNSLMIADMGFSIRSKLPDYPISMTNSEIFSNIGIVCSEDDFARIYNYQIENDDINDVYVSHVARYNFDNTDDEIYDIIDVIWDETGRALDDVVSEYGSDNGYSYTVDIRAEMKEALFGMYGSLLFLGIVLGIVFLFATVLIIYYKQISEGYEDRVRFKIMRNVGMSHKEVKSTIRSQILIVFFLPIVFAAIHVAVAFPILRRLLGVLELTQTGLFLLCTIIVFLIFILIYIIIYYLTARTYYKIVSEN